MTMFKNKNKKLKLPFHNAGRQNRTNMTSMIHQKNTLSPIKDEETTRRNQNEKQATGTIWVH